MKALIINILLKAGSEFLMSLLTETAETLKHRNDNTLNNDADEIKNIVKRNRVNKRR